jgi:hypothetical protein
VLVRRASRAERDGDWARAEAAYRAALERDPSVSSWHFRRGRALEHLERWTAAREAYETAVKHRKARPTWWYHLGTVRQRQKDWPGAAEAYQRAVAGDRSHADWYERLGLAPDHRQQRKRALTAFRTAVELDPTSWPVDDALLAVKSNFFTYRRDQTRFVADHLEQIQTRAAELRHAAAGRAPVPPRVFVYWGQGFDRAPEIVARCRIELDRWHDEVDVIELDDTAVPDYLDVPEHVRRIQTEHRAHYSDYLRCALLQRHGGVWADATLLATGSILDRLPSLLPSGFFVFRFGSGDAPSISNWFVAATAGNPMITTLTAALEVYWQHHDRPNHYFFFHHVFEALVHLDPAFGAGWRATAEHPDDDPRALLACMYEPWDPDRAAAALAGSFVHKLSHKGKGARFAPERMLSVLTEHPDTAWGPGDAGSRGRTASARC